MRKKNKSMVLQKTKFVRREEKRRNMHGSKKKYAGHSYRDLKEW